MINTRFGFSQVGQETEIDRVMQLLEKADSISAQLVIREAYEMTYGIHDHENGVAHPWNLVLHRHKEETSGYSALYRTIQGFKLKEIHKKYGLNLVEFLELPRELVEYLFRLAESEDRKDQQTQSKVQRDLENTFRS